MPWVIRDVVDDINRRHGLPVDYLGGAPGGHPALTTGTAGATANLRASKCATSAIGGGRSRSSATGTA
jgi:hypothetical protein